MLHFKIKYNCLLLLVFVLSLSACSHTRSSQSDSTSQEFKILRVNYESIDQQPKPEDNQLDYLLSKKDHWEKVNRAVFRFNTGMDNLLVKPTAKVYNVVLPDFFNKSISNFFSNLEDVGNTVNNMLQRKPRDAINDSARFLFNSSFGLGGLLDVASEMGLPKHHEDFGQTLATWGVGSGPYLVLPVLGPSTVRDAVARLSVDLFTNPVSYHKEASAIIALKLLDDRADLLAAEEAFKDLSEDQYTATRDVWLQRRDYLIRDGNSDAKQQSDLIDELESLDAE